MKKIVLMFAVCFLTSQVYSQNYLPGYYYTYEGQKIEGLIKHNFQARMSSKPDNSISFKKNESSKKILLTTKEIKSFVINKDSFALIKDFEINSVAYYKEDFAKVVKIGSITLYAHYSTGGSGMTYFELVTYLVS
ncbi:MAG: hypothetical protein H7Y04_16840, partial [Verrucomicrobia bacterium]|nr:hypothetical protein [Cytophagales bacterium]